MHAFPGTDASNDEKWQEQAFKDDRAEMNTSKCFIWKISSAKLLRNEAQMPIPVVHIES